MPKAIGKYVAHLSNGHTLETNVYVTWPLSAGQKKHMRDQMNKIVTMRMSAQGVVIERFDEVKL